MLTTLGVTASSLSKCSDSLLARRIPANFLSTKRYPEASLRITSSFSREVYPRPAAPPSQESYVASRSLPNLVLLDLRDR
jgi:hypothetical protein